MKTVFFATLLFTVLTSLMLIPALSGEVFVLNTVSQTISRLDLTTGTVDNTFAITGLYPNMMATTGEYIYLTNSADDNLRKYDIETGALLATIPLEQYSNPYDIVIHENHAYVTGMLTDSVYKIDLATDSVVAELEVGVAPLGMALHENLLFVANSGYQYPTYLPGELTLIDLESYQIQATIDVPLNPQRMVIDTYGALHLVCTGDYANETGNIAIIDTSTLDIVQTISLEMYPINIVITPLDRVYVADGFGNGLFAYDLPGYDIIHDCDNLFSTGGSALAVYEEFLLVADAGDFISNSTIMVYDFDESLLETYQTALGAIDFAFAQNNSSIPDDSTIPSPVILSYPNPFSRSVEILIESNDIRQEEITVEIFNIRGEKIRVLKSEKTKVQWDGYDLTGRRSPSGVYFYKIFAGTANPETGKITLIR